MPPVTTVHLTSQRDPGAPGRVVTDADVDLLVVGDVNILKPDGSRLAHVRRGVIPEGPVRETARDVFRMLRNAKTHNRGTAAGVGSRHWRVKQDGTVTSTSETVEKMPSAVIGYMARYPRTPFCRETAFTAKHRDAWRALQPFFDALAGQFQVVAPFRFDQQMARCRQTNPAFVIEGTPWTTVTVNRNWATRLHVDKGDFGGGLSTLAVLRSGSYTGGVLVFPAFRVGVDLQDGDAVYMDSHEFHANTDMILQSDDAERISTVLYYRTKMAECGTPEEELERAKSVRGDLSVSFGEGTGSEDLDDGVD